MVVLLPTADEETAIHNGNREIINRYYLANYDYIKRVAKSYCARVNFNAWEDLTQEVYLYFDKLDFDSPAFFGHCLFKVFSRYRYGGERKRAQLKDSKCGIEYYVLDQPIKGEEKEITTIGESIASDFDMFAVIFPRPDITESLFNYLCVLLGNAKERKRVFAQFYWTGNTYNEVAEVLNKNVRTVKRTREECFKIFRNNSDMLMSWLYSVGYY